MIGDLIIDGHDAWRMFRINALDMSELIAYPPLKAPQTTSYPEEDGVDVDLESPKLDTRTFTVRFSIHGIESDYIEFANLLSDKGYHTFHFASINRQYRLRLVSMPEYDYVRYLGFVNVKFADDFPMDITNRVYLKPIPHFAQKWDFLLDGKPFTAYGARVLEGACSQLMRLPDTKTNATSKSNSISGVLYDTDIVTFQAKDVTLQVLFRADTLQTLWRNYDALLHDLIRPNERILTVHCKGIDQGFPCYYKKSSVKEFYPEGQIWLKAEITLTLTRSLRIDSKYCYLVSEDGKMFFTEETLQKMRIVPKDI